MSDILILYLIMLSVLVLLSYVWVLAIDSAKEKYPDYKGEDLFDDNDK